MNTDYIALTLNPDAVNNMRRATGLHGRAWFAAPIQRLRSTHSCPAPTPRFHPGEQSAPRKRWAELLVFSAVAGVESPGSSEVDSAQVVMTGSSVAVEESARRDGRSPVLPSWSMDQHDQSTSACDWCRPVGLGPERSCWMGGPRPP